VYEMIRAVFFDFYNKLIAFALPHERLQARNYSSVRSLERIANHL
jgi:FMN phosphatase YigB (HAD superfamily)